MGAGRRQQVPEKHTEVLQGCVGWEDAKPFFSQGQLRSKGIRQLYVITSLHTHALLCALWLLWLGRCWSLRWRGCQYRGTNARVQLEM